MINIKEENILNATEDIICQQVNCRGVMGSGLAIQIKEKYPEVYEEYKHICCNLKPEQLLGLAQIVDCKDGKSICNIFGQLDYGVKTQQTSYSALWNGLDSIFNTIKSYGKHNKKSVAIPYRIGCGLGGGDWDVVYKIIEASANSYGCDTTIYKYNK